MEHSPDFQVDIVPQVHSDRTHAFKRQSLASATGEDSSTSDCEKTDDNATGTNVNNTADKLKDLTLSGKYPSSYHAVVQSGIKYPL